ncbi:MAG: 2-amino-4-hydroxy-6-hydroxymethyldihydropteridine diphosphokinase [Gammaproteobacteria bacterium]
MTTKDTSKKIIKFVEKSSFQLIEALAENVSKIIMQDEKGVESFSICIQARRTSRIKRSRAYNFPLEIMPKIYLSLGSNIKPEENLNKAKELLSQEYQSEKESKTYKTKSEGFEGEDFLNQVVCLYDRGFCRQRWLATLKDIEKKIGRKDRTEKFSDREIDIDLLLYGNYVGKASRQRHTSQRH